MTPGSSPIHVRRLRHDAGQGEIRRVNINAAPSTSRDTASSRRQASGLTRSSRRPTTTPPIGRFTRAGSRKADYLWRLDFLGRAMEAGLDDVGIGALFGLYDWRFEVLGLVSHARICRTATTAVPTRSAFRGCGRPPVSLSTTVGWSPTTTSSGSWLFCG